MTLEQGLRGWRDVSFKLPFRLQGVGGWWECPQFGKFSILWVINSGKRQGSSDMMSELDPILLVSELHPRARRWVNQMNKGAYEGMRRL